MYNKEVKCKPTLANVIFSTIYFLLGSLTSIFSGYLGMKIVTYANARTTLEARKGVGKAFINVFRSSVVMGFLLAANGLLVLYVVINLFKLYYENDWEGLSEAITGYGLGGSSMALFGRVGGGIYTKAADISADLVGKVERNIPEDDPHNPVVIANNVVTMLDILLVWDQISLSPMPNFPVQLWLLHPYHHFKILLLLHASSCKLNSDLSKPKI